MPSAGNPQSFNRYSYVLNNPLKYIDPTGHDPLDDDWQEWFMDTYGVEPTSDHIAIRLFSIAFPDEFDALGGWDYFVGADGGIRAADNDPNTARWVSVFTSSYGRSWNDMPTALKNMAKYYLPWETDFFIRDIGTLFAGLGDRLHWFAYTALASGQIQQSVYISGDGISNMYNGGPNAPDADSNVHHWAAFVVTGYYMTASISMLINMGREATQGSPDRPIATDDVLLGNVGAQMGAMFSYNGIVTPWAVGIWWNSYAWQFSD